MWFWMTDVSVALSLIAETQDGSCECQTAETVEKVCKQRQCGPKVRAGRTHRACEHG